MVAATPRGKPKPRRPRRKAKKPEPPCEAPTKVRPVGELTADLEQFNRDMLDGFVESDDPYPSDTASRGRHFGPR